MTEAVSSIDGIGRLVSVPNTPLETVLNWADVLIEDGEGGDRILLSGKQETEGDATLRVGATFMPESDSTVGDTFNEVTIPRDSQLVEVGGRFYFNFTARRQNRPGCLHFSRISSLAICWPKVPHTT